ncbi:hypothetical protein CRG98_025788 [Punica granatum]|uniref:Serine carboxypeptidase-like 18 n=1 Tax=Punica granatum TaxID=22663 RepID=A0A2I0JC01_PUNGR|nr:hypothetical protein CRG98_025788 [Punica granatum]
MGKFTCSVYGKCLYRVLLLVVFMWRVASQSIVEYLPGYPGKLPFKLETGYISVEDSELFYYFIESQGNPKEDPILLWLTGGPGCSSFHCLIYQIGPMEFDIENYAGGLPRLQPYEYAWTKTASIIFLDSPVGTGFSYSTTAEGWYTSDSKSASQAYQFLRKWMVAHPQYLALQLIIGGDSYSGMIVPVVTKYVVDGKIFSAGIFVLILGYIVGSPRTDSVIDENSKIVFAYRMALISDELYEAAKKSCKENYVNVDPSNTKCTATLEIIERCVKDIYKNNILEPKCVFASPKMDPEVGHRSVLEKPAEFILSPPRIPDLWCRNFNYAMSYWWSNDIQVQKALNVRPGTVLDWKRCNKSLAYTKDVPSVVYVHKELSKLGLELLVECGDRDMVVPYVGTVNWITSLNLTVVNDWRSWLVDGQIAGYTKKYSEHGFRLTYTTIKGAGHPAQEYYRRECYEMFNRWIHYYPM